MDLQEFFKSDKAVAAGMWMARLTPRWFGYSLARYTGNRIAKNRSGVYAQLSENISHIPGTNEEPGQLHELTRRALINAGKYYYDFYHMVGKPPTEVIKKVDVPEDLLEMVRNFQASGRGVQLAGIHLSNFDLGSITLGSHGLEILGLSAANPNQGYEFQNKIRQKYGFVATPIEPKSLREAITKLKNGGIVAGAIDWPKSGEPELTEVFGKPAHIPLGVARLAIMTNAVTIAIAFYKDSHPRYQMYYSEPLDVIRTGNKQEEIKLNNRKYLDFFEKAVSQHPDQWMMFHKFWADQSEN